MLYSFLAPEHRQNVFPVTEMPPQLWFNSIDQEAFLKLHPTAGQPGSLLIAFVLLLSSGYNQLNKESCHHSFYVFLPVRM